MGKTEIVMDTNVAVVANGKTEQASLTLHPRVHSQVATHTG